MKFVIENLEHKLPKWCFLEYEHISLMVGKSNVIFTNMNDKISKELSVLGNTTKEHAGNFIPLSAKVCILDMDCKKELTPEESKKFDYFVFGGILGDHPPTGKTKMLYDSNPSATAKWEKRSLGSRQMTTDTAVDVVNRIIKGASLGKISFVDDVEIEIISGEDSGESIILPFRYVKADNKEGAMIYPKLLEYIKKNEGF